MTERTYKCPNCGAVKTIDQKKADESRVLQGEIPAFVWCMSCKRATGKKVRAWAEDETRWLGGDAFVGDPARGDDSMVEGGER